MEKNHFVAVPEPKIVNRKDVYKGKNLHEAPGDEILGSLPIYFAKRSPVLKYPTHLVNISTKETPHIKHLVQSLLEEEKREFIEFFMQKKIIFLGHI